MKNKNQFELAVYGKGGIGKSTISANLSAAIAFSGKKVMQIGCDPKHDSTRLLMHGKTIPTVLEYLRDKEVWEQKVEDILFHNTRGIACIEAGGPRPGVGCAGRGIISAFEFLEKYQAKDPYEIIVYDVLGDVVCGGFAVPVRREYADAIYLVTSGEYMALYAANNILRGIRNFDGDQYKRVAGIIYNERKITDEDGRVERFAKAVGLPICARVPRSNAFAAAEEKKIPLMEIEGYEEEKEVFLRLAESVIQGTRLYMANPLTDEELEAAVLGISGEVNREEIENENLPEKQDIVPMERTILPEHNRTRLPLYGCAFNGAATTAIHLTDALVLAHSPKACAFYTWQNISSPGRKNLFNRGILMPSAINPHFACTNMGQAETVFGGMERLQECVEQALKKKPGAVLVISSCVSGIIGDDIRAIEDYSTEEIPVIALSVDGVLSGDYMEGIRSCMYTLAERLIDRRIQPSGKRVNFVNEIGVGNNSSVNFTILRDLLTQMGITVNCRFLGDATCQEMKHFLAAPLNILASDSQDSLELKKWLMEEYCCEFMDDPFPVGFQATSRWIKKLGTYFDCEKEAELVIQKQEISYVHEIEKLRPILAGKKILLTTINTNLDWMIDVADGIGMKFVWIGVLNYLHQDLHVTDKKEIQERIEETDSHIQIHQKIEEYKPDIVLSNYTSMVEPGDYLIDSMPMTPIVGFHSAFSIFWRWVDLLKLNREEEWKNDRDFFQKYYF